MLYYFVDKFTAFENVHSDQVILSAIKGRSTSHHKFRYFADFTNAVAGNAHFTAQNDFSENQDCEFIFGQSVVKSEGIADLGVLYETVTGIQIGIGGDRQYNGVEIESLFYADVRVSKNWFPIISLLGKDFFKYCAAKFRGFLNFDEELGYKINRDVPKCNIAIPKYKNYVSEPKVVVRQSSDSIVASYVEESCVAEYSAFSIRQKTSEFSLKYLLAILNSKYITYYSRKNNIIKTGHKKQPQIRIKGLDAIPIRKISGSKQAPFIKLVERILAAKAKAADADVRQLEREIDELVYALYALTPAEIDIVKGAAK